MTIPKMTKQKVRIRNDYNFQTNFCGRSIFSGWDIFRDETCGMVDNQMKPEIEEYAKMAEDMCNDYCKYPLIWDEERLGDLSESEICENCPIVRFGVRVKVE